MKNINTTNLPGYSFGDNLYQGTRTLVYRGTRTGDQQPVVIKALRNPHPNFNELVQFRNQYVITRHLEHPAIVKPLALERSGNGYALVMPDTGEVALKDYWQQSNRSLAEFLAIAIQLSDALHYLIQQRIIHKDIKPSNILIHPETGFVKLIDFSISSLLPKEQQQLANPNLLEGTLAYISPEQTGRMNRGIDYRTDFYSLGVTFFELLSGKLPFSTDEPMELVHCHIAKMPTELGKRGAVEVIPAVLSDIVLKLMAKNAEDRYQSALGLKYDLERCLQEWEATGEIASFEIGTRDRSDRFIIPEKLYGREMEVQTLLDAFGRVAGGTTEMMLVAGFSGIGKTAVVNEVHKPIVKQRGYFIKGKYDQLNRNIPFSAFVQAFRDLMGQLLGESDTELTAWKAKILEAVGESGQVIMDVIPELERIIGKQPPVTELSGSAAQNRFNLLFGKFIRVFATIEHPLVIFLDDLQWADLASLNLLKLLMDGLEEGYLLVLGAYRDNEVFRAHPFMLALDDIAKGGAVANTLTLAPLDEVDITRLVADTLLCSVEIAAPLSQLVYQKTGGNPFFTAQFLTGLHEDRWIAFDTNAGYWQCDLSQVRQLALTDDVVEFMVGRLQKLPEATQAVLKLAACIGDRFDLGTLAVVCECSQDEVAASLWNGLQEGFIVPQSETYKFFQESDRSYKTLEAGLVNYRFLHDRVQQAAYSLIPATQKQLTHLNIGRLFVRKYLPQEREEKIFTFINQLNQGSQLVNELREREQIVELNLVAGKKARAATAYNSAVEYAKQGIALLERNSWEAKYNITFELYCLAVETLYLVGEFKQMQDFAVVALQHAKTPLEKSQINEVKISSYIARKQLEQALALGIQTLKELRVDFPTAPSEADIQELLAQTFKLIPPTGVAALNRLPILTDENSIAAMRIMNVVMAPMYQTRGDLLIALFLLAVRLSITSGNTEISPLFYGCYGTVLCAMLDDIETGSAFSDLALNLLAQFQSKTFHSRAYLMVAIGTIHWKNHLQQCISVGQLGIETGWETGDLENTAWNYFYCNQASYIVGKELSELKKHINITNQAILQMKQQLQLEYSLILQQAVFNLLGESEDICLLVGAAIDESKLISQYNSQALVQGLFCIYFHKAILAYLFECYALSVENSERAFRYIAGVPGQILIPVLNFYDSMSRIALYPSKSQEEQVQLWTAIETNQAKLEHWASYAPMNFAHKFHLVAAEQNRIIEARAVAIDLYDRAIAGAKENEYLQEEGLANELAAKFYLEWGKQKFAAVHMQEAYYCYARWGAKAKTDQLEAKYPQLLAPILQQQRVELNPIDSLETTAKMFATIVQEGTQTGIHVSEALDFAAILQAAQTLSSTMELDELLANIVRIILTNAGAQKAVLLAPEKEQWQVRAMARLTDDGSVETSTKSQSLTAESSVPLRLVQYVKNTEKPVLIDEAKTEIGGILQGYILKDRPQSAFCAPLLDRGNLVAILYLEHRTTKGVFAPNRQTIIQFLCAQAAISLENARLYSESKNYVERLERSLQTLQKTQSQLIRDEQIMQAQILAISNLYQSKAISSGELKTSFQELTTATARTLKVERASIWFFDEERTKIDCIDLFESSCERHSDGFELFVADNPNYFNAVYGEALLVSNDAQNDPKTSDFKDGYLVPLNIVSMLDANVLLNGKIYGILCCEQVGSKRVWTQAEQNFVRSVANLITLTLEANLRSQKEKKLELALLDLKQSQLQLVQSEKMSALGNLVAGVAHEINNPTGFLQGNIKPARDYVEDLLGLIDLLLVKCPSNDPEIETEIEAIELEFIREDLPKLLESMNVGVERIRSISKSLRTFSRKDRERKTKFDIHNGIDSTLLILKHRTKAKQQHPAVEIVKNYANIQKVECFPGQLNQVFMNILANAIDAFDEANEGKTYSEIETKPNRIIIRTAIVEERLQIQISDNGSGMKPETVERIFEQGFTTKAVGKGTGLGMAIAHNIVTEKHGGTITCDSKLGVGTTFTIELPIGG